MRLLIVIGALGFASIGIVEGYWLLIPLAAVLAGVAFHHVDKDKVPRDHVVRFLSFLDSQDWASLLLLAILFASTAGWFGQKLQNARWPGILWLIGIALLVWSTVLYEGQYVDKNRRFPSLLSTIFGRWHRWEWIALSAITLFALLVRVYRIDQLLPFIHGDEGEMGMRALQVLRGDIPEFHNEQIPLFATSFLNHPTLFYYLQAFVLWIGGESIVSLRLLSACFGALCVPLIYATGRLGWGWIAGLTAAWLLAVSHIHIQFSRIALNNIESVWFALLCVFLLLLVSQDWHKPELKSLSLEPRPASVLPYAALGFATGLAQYMYYGSRLLPVIITPVFILLGWKQRISKSQLIFFGLAVLVAYLPILSHFIQNPESFSNRSSGVFVLNPTNLSRVLGENYSVWRDVPILLLTQTERVVRFFIDRGDISSFYIAEFAGLDPVTAVSFWCGLGMSAIAYRRIAESILLLWFGLGLLLAGILTSDPPNAPRLIVVVPVTFLFAGIFMQRLCDYFALGKVSVKRSVLVMFITVLTIAGYVNMDHYFMRFAKVMGSLAPSTIGLEVAQIKDDTQIILLGAPHLYVEYGVLRFLDRGAEMYNLDNIADLQKLLAEHPTDKKRMFIVMPYRSQDLAALRERYPQSLEVEHRDPVDRLLYTTFKPVD